MLKKLKSFDNFGVPVAINYRGMSSYQTLGGALLSLISAGLLLTFTVTGCIELLTYQNPQITQYQVLDTRNDDKEVNFEETNTEVLFGFLNREKWNFVVPDPRICSFQLESVTFDSA